MKNTNRFVIIEEPQSISINDSDPLFGFCPFTPDHNCKKRSCMMFVDISIRDVEHKKYYYKGTGEGRCGLVNVSDKSRMFTYYGNEGANDYFIGEIEP